MYKSPLLLIHLTIHDIDQKYTISKFYCRKSTLFCNNMSDIHITHWSDAALESAKNGRISNNLYNSITNAQICV